MDALSRQQVRQVDRWAIDQLGIAGVVLMENAGRQAADVAQQMLEGCAGRSVAIVAGAGNNGGDGFVLARHLRLRGAAPTVYLIVPPEKLTGDAAANYRILTGLNLPVRIVDGKMLATLADDLAPTDLVIDAIGGTGITGDLREPAAEAVRQINAAGRPVLAIDIPTGLDCDTGQSTEPTVRADATVTFVARKKGFDNPASQAYAGNVIVADIGVDPNWEKLPRPG